uniref:Uncharacterized protein n=1 Tax=viral metagenome TaxID=1070528 RepID=A0A6M3IG06_9ZZZZ
MPDPITNIENTEPVTDSTSSSEDKSPAQTESEFMDATIKDIKQTQKAILGQETKGDDDGHIDSDSNSSSVLDDSTGRITGLAGTDIPEAFSSVAEELGMTPAEIVAIADAHTDEQLLEMAAFLKESAGVDDLTDEDDTTETETKEDNTKPKDATQELIDQAVAKIKAELGVSLDDINKFKEQQVAQQDKQMLETANRKFDEAAKEFPIFGSTEKLPRFTTGKLKGQFIPTSPAFKARMEVVKYADAFMGMGNSVEEAMDLALSTYKGKNLRTEMERALIKDLKRHEQNLSGVRTGKETKKKHADSREEIIDEIRELQRKAGVEV